MKKLYPCSPTNGKVVIQDFVHIFPLKFAVCFDLLLLQFADWKFPTHYRPRKNEANINFNWHLKKTNIMTTILLLYGKLELEAASKIHGLLLETQKLKHAKAFSIKFILNPLNFSKTMNLKANQIEKAV